MIKITLDKTTSCITLAQSNSTLQLKGLGYIFICALIANRTNKLVEVGNLHRMPLWRNMKKDSVGKQASRIINQLEKRGFNIIKWHRKTGDWQLDPSFGTRISKSTVDAARLIIESPESSKANLFEGLDTIETANWFSQNISALINLTTGNVEKSEVVIRNSMQQVIDMRLANLSNPLATRIGQKLPRPYLPIPIEFDITHNTLEFAIEARVSASQAIRTQSEEWHNRFTELKKILSKALEFGDLTTLAWVYNALSILARRLGKLEEALDYIKQAAALSILTGDLIFIQAVTFNFGNILSEKALNEEVVDKEEITLAMLLLDLDVEIRQNLQIGKDSAQAELRLCEILIRLGKPESAKKMLYRANEIISNLSSNADLALKHKLESFIELLTGTDPKQFDAAIKHFDTCQYYFARAGDQKSAFEANSEWNFYLNQSKVTPKH